MTFPTHTTSAECQCPMTIDRVGRRGLVEVFVVFVDHDSDCLLAVLADIEATAAGAGR